MYKIILERKTDGIYVSINTGEEGEESFMTEKLELSSLIHLDITEDKFHLTIDQPEENQ